MSSCKECLHYEVCKNNPRLIELDEHKDNYCGAFKPKSRFVELPCEVGQTVYVLENDKFWNDGEWEDVLTEEKVKALCFYGEYDTVIFAEDFGKTVFLSREQAEKALKEREKE